MKIHFIKSSLILAFAFSVAATGCLKDKGYENGSTQSGSPGGTGQDVKVISLGLNTSSSTFGYTDYNGDGATYPGVQFLQQSYPLTDNDTTIDIVPVELGGTSDATQDIHVTLTEDDDLINTYDDSTGSDLVNPGSVITIVNPGNVVVIPKGSRIGYLQVKFKISDLLLGDFAYGFRITSIAESGYTISGNLSAGVVGIGPKNRWDGLYQLTIQTTGWGAYSIADGQTFTWPTRAKLITTGLSTVVLHTSETGISEPAFDPSGGLAGFGATEVQFTFDPATNNLTSVDNRIPDDGRGRVLVSNPAVTDNRYDPATQTIYASWIMKQNGRPNQFFYDTLVYKGSR